MKKGLYIMVDNGHMRYKQGQLLEHTGDEMYTDGYYTYLVFAWRVEFVGEI